MLKKETKAFLYLLVPVFRASGQLDTDTDLLKHLQSYFLQNINTPLNNSCTTNTHDHTENLSFIINKEVEGGMHRCVSSDEQEKYVQAASSSFMVQQQLCVCECMGDSGTESRGVFLRRKNE